MSNNRLIINDVNNPGSIRVKGATIGGDGLPRRTTLDGRTEVFRDGAWVPEVVVKVTDAAEPPKGRELRVNYLAELKRINRDSCAAAANPVASVPEAVREATTPKDRYLAELERRGRGA